MKNFAELNAMRKLERGEHVVIEAFGSSNTQRRLPGMTWFDFVELGLKKKYGPGCGNFINTGIGGHTSTQLLERFDRDVKTYRPDLVIITVGGNDSNPVHQVTPEKFQENLRELHKQISAFGGEVLFQTYYACQLENVPPEMARRFDLFMRYIGEAAEETGSAFNDNYTRWNRLRSRFPELYRMLMKDSMHVTADGNSVIGLDLLNRFGVELEPEYLAECKLGVFARTLLDLL